MIHTFKAVGQPMLLDVGSGAVHAIDELAYDVLEKWNESTPEEIKAALTGKYTAEELDEVIGELKQLEEIGALIAPDNYDNVEQIGEPGT
ncbi:MAG: thioether cross-link-forming SCIFF peptide maturase, partial [Clostridia bacterium]|nr:thioether cross-link-forming SCIFF peptide maturase [Clostridia bacterium]